MEKEQLNRYTSWKLGLSSYAYRWSIGSTRDPGKSSLDVRGLVTRASQLALQGVQICDNLPYQELPAAALRKLRTEASDLGIFIETGARGTNPDYLSGMLQASGRLGSRLLRVVAEIDRNSPKPGISAQLNQICEDIMAVLGSAKSQGIKIALENHATLSSRDLLYIVNAIGDESVGICLDTMNSILLMERPLETTRALAPHTLCVHFKDFRIEKRAEDFRIIGVPLGEGLVDVAAILNIVKEHHMKPSLHLELYIGRIEGYEATLRYEDECVRRSVVYLRKILQEK